MTPDETAINLRLPIDGALHVCKIDMPVAVFNNTNVEPLIPPLQIVRERRGIVQIVRHDIPAAQIEAIEKHVFPDRRASAQARSRTAWR